MSAHEISPDEATRALAEIRERRRQVAEQAEVFPWWYLAAVGTLMFLFMAAFDTHSRVVTGTASALYVALITTVVIRANRSGRVRATSQLAGRRGTLVLMAFVALFVAFGILTSMVAFGAGLPYPTTFMGAVLGAGFVLFGLAMRPVLRRIMVRNAERAPR